MMRLILFFLFLIYFTYQNTFAQCSRLDSLYRITRVAKTTEDKVNTLNAIAEELIELRKEKQAKFYAQKALDLATEDMYRKGMADALTHIALLSAENIHQLETTIGEYEKALSIYKEMKNKKKVIQVLEIIGYYTYKAQSRGDARYINAIDYYKQAIDLRKQLEIDNPVEIDKNKEKIVENYEMLGELYGFLKKDKEALLAFEQATDIKRNMGTDDIRNSYILAKYKRIQALEEHMQAMKMSNVIIVMSLVVVAMLIIMLIMVGQRNRAIKQRNELLAKANIG